MMKMKNRMEKICEFLSRTAPEWVLDKSAIMGMTIGMTLYFMIAAIPCILISVYNKLSNKRK